MEDDEKPTNDQTTPPNGAAPLADISELISVEEASALGIMAVGSYQISRSPDGKEPASKHLVITLRRGDPHKISAVFNPRDCQAEADPEKPQIKMTRIDVDLRRIARRGDYVRITMKVPKGAKMRFRPDLIDSTTGAVISYAFSAGTPEGPTFFTDLFPPVIGNNVRSITFRCKMRTGTGPLLPYNLGLLVVDDEDDGDDIYEIPMVYDPKVQNDG